MTEPALPTVPYAAMYRNDRPSAIAASVAQVAAEACDFTRQFQQSRRVKSQTGAGNHP